MSAVVSVMGPGGAPMRLPYGSFAGKPPFVPSRGIVSVMGPAGAPMKEPYGSFKGKPPFTPTKPKYPTVVGDDGIHTTTRIGQNQGIYN